jgi:hypothetical protein
MANRNRINTLYVLFETENMVTLFWLMFFGQNDALEHQPGYICIYEVADRNPLSVELTVKWCFRCETEDSLVLAQTLRLANFQSRFKKC